MPPSAWKGRWNGAAWTASSDPDRKVWDGASWLALGGAEWTDNPREAHMALTPSMLEGLYQLNTQRMTVGDDEMSLAPSMQGGAYDEIAVRVEVDPNTMSLTPSMQDGVYQEV